MKIQNIGGATAIVEHQGKRMLFDPWMNEGILSGSWYHWPKLNVTLSEIGRLDYIYISHIHEDHCAPDTIRHLNRDAEIIIMDREPAFPNFVKRFLKSNRFDFKKVHLIRPETPTEIAQGLIVDMVTADPAHEYNYQIDSGLILKWGGKVIYNANDCAPYPGSITYIKKHYGTIDLALLPYAGGSGYPGCYANLSHDEKMCERERIFRQQMQLFVDTVLEIGPHRVMPFADQYVMGGSRGYLNQYSPHPPSPGYVKDYLASVGLDQKLVLLNSGQSYDLDNGLKQPDEPYYLHTEAEREEYIRELFNEKYDYQEIALRDVVPIGRIFAHARAKLWAVQESKGNFPDCTLYFCITNRDQLFKLDYRSKAVEELPFDSKLEQPYLKLSMDASLFAMLLINQMSWNMADAFIDYERVPNIYNQQVYVLLNHLTI
jgi:UDP-MurNAc hydroxylase